MNRKIKWLFTITIGIIAAIGLISMLSESRLAVPKADQLSSVIFINVVNEQGVEKITISEQSDIGNLLEILKNSERTDKDSVSDLPDKAKFSMVAFEMLEGYSLRSIYEENGDIYVDQPYYGVFKLRSNDLNILNEIMKRGNKQSISIHVDEIFKYNF